MEIEKQTNIVKPRKIVSNKEVLEEIKKLFQEEINTNPECISLYDVSQLLKETWEQEKIIRGRYQNEFDYIIRNSENTTGRVLSIIFDYPKKQLNISYGRSNSIEKVIYSKREDDLYIISTSDKYYAQKTLVLLGNLISKLYDELLEHKEFDYIGWHSPESVNSNFLISINSLDINISSVANQKETNFHLSTWHSESKYQYNCNSNNIISEIKGQESELFKRIFIKIEDCPEWTRPILSNQRLEALERDKREKDLIQMQAEKKLKRQELLRKIFPFLNPQPPKITMKESEIEAANRHIYLEDKLSKLDIMQSENKLTERTLNILFTKLRYEDDETLSLKDLEYLVNAYLMPYDEIEREMERYDSSHPKLDEIKFVDELATRYNVDRNKIIKRINEIRNINKLKQIELENKTKIRSLTAGK